MTCSTDFLATIEAARTGDEAALNSLFLQFYPLVQRVVHRSLAADMRTERPWLTAMFSTGDVVQDVFLLVLRDLSEFHGTTQGEFVNYLTTVTRHRIVDAVRFHEAVRRDRRRVRGSLDGVDREQQHADPSEIVVSAEEVALYCRALSGLPHREQHLLRARAEGSLGFSQIAEQLGYPSADATRKAYCVAKARLLTRLRAWRRRDP